MSTPHVVFLVFIGLGAIWTVLWAWIVLLHRRPGLPYAELESATHALRHRLVPIAIGIVILGVLVSIPWLPYRWVRAGTVGQPRVTVHVRAGMWYWTLTPTEVPAGVPVEFVVTSNDVNHGFGLYSPDGTVLTQVQAMPEYTNHLVYRFEAPGAYTMRCLEYCGLGHVAMVAPLTVVPAGTSSSSSASSPASAGRG